MIKERKWVGNAYCPDCKILNDVGHRQICECGFVTHTTMNSEIYSISLKRKNLEIGIACSDYVYNRWARVNGFNNEKIRKQLYDVQTFEELLKKFDELIEQIEIIEMLQ